MSLEHIAKLCLNGLVCTKNMCQLWVEAPAEEGNCVFKALGYELHEIVEELRLIRFSDAGCLKKGK